MDSFVLVPKNILDKLITNQEKLFNKISEISTTKNNINNSFKYISESEAQTLLNKGSTWFWKMRTEGKIGYTKVGNSIFYLKTEIDELLDKNFIPKF